MAKNEQQVFISYAWGEETSERKAIANQIDKSLQKRGLKIIRDKRDLDYKGSIRKFMELIGEGEKQCWNPRSTIASVQWCVWVYALLFLSAYRARGLLNAPPIPTRWWKGAKRWSFNTLWRQFRAAFWGSSQFQALWTRTPDNWLKKEAFLIGLSNSIAASARI